jgi:hypothetical protein
VRNNPLRYVDPNGEGAWEEFLFSINHPLAALAIGEFEHNATNISTDATRFAINIGLQENASRQGSPINAVRHALWQATITAQFGEQIAEEAGDAHEDNPHALDGIGTFLSAKIDNSKDADQAVDLLNNIIGRRLGAAGASMKDLAREVLNYYHDYGLWTSTPIGNGSFAISITRLSDNQYQQALANLQYLDGNGFTPYQRGLAEQEMMLQTFK